MICSSEYFFAFMLASTDSVEVAAEPA
jgi:hypothetical protein